MSDVRTVRALLGPLWPVLPGIARDAWRDAWETMKERGILDLPLIGPAHSAAVLDGMTVEELEAIAITWVAGSRLLLADEQQRMAARGVVRVILAAANITIPEGYATVKGVLEWNLEVVPEGDFIVREGQRVAFLGKEEG